jgi:hypothetical protein
MKEYSIGFGIHINFYIIFIYLISFVILWLLLEAGRYEFIGDDILFLELGNGDLIFILVLGDSNSF